MVAVLVFVQFVALDKRQQFIVLVFVKQQQFALVIVQFVEQPVIK